MFHSTVPDPKVAQQLLDHIVDEFDDIHDRGIALLQTLVVPLEKYIETQNLAKRLAKNEEQCVRQEAVIR